MSKIGVVFLEHQIISLPSPSPFLKRICQIEKGNFLNLECACSEKLRFRSALVSHSGQTNFEFFWFISLASGSKLKETLQKLQHWLKIDIYCYKNNFFSPPGWTPLLPQVITFVPD